VTVKAEAGGRYTLVVSGVRFGLEVGSPIVRVGDKTRQLASSPVVQKGQLLVPLQLVSEVIPDVVVNTSWDAEHRHLVLFSMVEHAGRQAEPSRSSSVASGGDVARRPILRDGETAVRQTGRPTRRIIIVDAGHGGPDNGMTGPLGGGPRLIEKDITLAVARRLGGTLKERGVDIVYTRTTDTLIALSDRGRIANRSNGDLFISIHVNAANPNWKDPGGSRGFETYFLAEAKTEDARRVEQMENEAAKYDDAPERDPDNPLGFILSDMEQNEHLRESSELADLIQQSLGRMHPGPSRGVKQAGFRVLVTAYMPSVLVEIGFGTNPREAAYLSAPDKQQAIADAIAEAAIQYLQRYERRVAGPTK
jgi:N-acetylmuramoyl-L-alanine amidase